MKISVLSLVPNNNICCILVIYMQDSDLLLLTHRSHQFHLEVWAFLICLNRPGINPTLLQSNVKFERSIGKSLRLRSNKR